jgi:hypothetical protein
MVRAHQSELLVPPDDAEERRHEAAKKPRIETPLRLPRYFKPFRAETS